MELLNWTAIFIIVSGSVGFYLLIKQGIEQKTLRDVLISIALIPIILLNIWDLISLELGDFVLITRWFTLTSLLFICSSLLEFIRESKPKFSKFPIYLIFTPFITLFVYPLAIETKVISDMLILTYQAGSIIVGFLLYGIHHTKTRNKKSELISLVLFTISFLVFWFMNSLVTIDTELISKFFMGIGILTFSIGNKSIK